MSLGDRQLASTVVTNFTTAVGGLPTVLSGSPAISIYKNNTTESTTGVTLNVSYDSRVGMNQVVIDTSADGTFYATGNDFSIVITTGTVGGISVVGTVVEEFSIGKGNVAYFASQAITAAAGVTLPSSVASPTNITAGTITTVTNLTNAPTAGDLTATMKTSVTTAATAATPIAASVTGAVGSVTGNVGGNIVGSVASVTAPVAVTSNVKKNASGRLSFTMTDSTNHAPQTGLTVASNVSIDGAAFGATVNSVTAIGNGDYTLVLAAGDTNGNTLLFRFTATAADDLNILVITQP